MTLPPLTPGLVSRLAPEARLQDHEDILSEIEGKLPTDISLEAYRRYLSIARENWNTDYVTARVFLEKADRELLDLQWRRSMEVQVGTKQLSNLDGRRERGNQVKKAKAAEWRHYAQAYALTTNLTKGALVARVKAKMDQHFAEEGKTFSESTIRRYLAPIMQKDFQTR